MNTTITTFQNSIVPDAVVRLFASSRTWIGSEALRQFHATARLEGVREAVAFPDLHATKGGAAGAAFVTQAVIYPSIIGSDVGCGMALFQTDLVQSDVKLERWAALRFDLENPWDGDVRELLESENLDSAEFDAALGTIGGDSHFAELQKVEQVLDAAAFKQLGLGKQQLVILVHSGSHGLGESVFSAYADEHQSGGMDAESSAAITYLEAHDRAVAWAKANRALIARRFAGTLGAQAERLWDACHNSITTASDRGSLSPSGEEAVRSDASAWIHRKGAVPANGEFVVIPGSNGALSYIVKPVADPASHAWSLAHGAGRKWSRSEARLRMRGRFEVQQLVQTGLGSRVICEDRELLYEEAPASYKNIETVVEDLVDAGLISVIATFRPLLTYKTRKAKR